MVKISYEWSFGYDIDLADRLKQLVLDGKKTATTGIFHDGMRLPKIGEYAAILDSNGKRFCIIKYTNIEVKAFLEVEYSFVMKEGEADKDIEEWREKHRKFFHIKSDDVQVVCEEFELVEIT